MNKSIVINFAGKLCRDDGDDNIDGDDGDDDDGDMKLGNYQRSLRQGCLLPLDTATHAMCLTNLLMDLMLMMMTRGSKIIMSPSTYVSDKPHDVNVLTHIGRLVQRKVMI